MQPDLRLKIDGQLYGGWQEVRIRRAIETIAGSFELAVTERWSGQDIPRPIRPGAACQVLINNKPVITGYVDDVGMSYDATSHTVSVSGRDKTGDLVDCSALPFQWLDVTMANAAKRLCEPYGISVAVEALNIDKKFSTYSPNPGDSVFTVLDGAAKIRGVMLLSDGNSGLIIARSSTVRLPAVLLLGENIKAASATFSHKDRFSEYTVTANQEVKDELTFAETAFLLVAKAKDAAITRPRPLLITSDKLIDRAQTQERANWERNVRFGKSQQVQYTVQGWLYDDTNVWPINRLVAVKDEFLGIDNDLLITGVNLLMDDSGLRTELTVGPREGWDLLAKPENDTWDKL